ncbi:MAG: ChbG/HpnK family deacetylase [Bacteroidetes bacterium]|nr:ChbG/HpnK family deacetylase [Bacteroidota bacterium]
MAKLIITADDYGLCEAANDGIRDCIKAGAVTSVQVLVNMVTKNEMIKLKIAIDQAAIKFGKRCGIGLHFNTTQGAALGSNAGSTLVDQQQNGNQFYSIKTIDCDQVANDDLKAECRAQLDALADFVDGYTNIDSISSHHNLHFFDARFTDAILEAVPEEIPFRSPVQWRSPGQEPDPRKYKDWYETMPVFKDSFITFQEAQEDSTKWVLNNAADTKFLTGQRTKMREKNHRTPVNCSEQWYGQPSHNCLVWIIKEMDRLQQEYNSICLKKEHKIKSYVSELYTHIASSAGNQQLDLTYAMPRRVAEYNVWKLYKVKTLLEECHKGFHPVELCSYRDALLAD